MHLAHASSSTQFIESQNMICHFMTMLFWMILIQSNQQSHGHLSVPQRTRHHRFLWDSEIQLVLWKLRMSLIDCICQHASAGWTPVWEMWASHQFDANFVVVTWSLGSLSSWCSVSIPFIWSASKTTSKKCKTILRLLLMLALLAILAQIRMPKQLNLNAGNLCFVLVPVAPGTWPLVGQRPTELIS